MFQGNFVLKRQVLYAVAVRINRICFISFEEGVLNGARLYLPDLMVLLHFIQFEHKATNFLPLFRKVSIKVI